MAQDGISPALAIRSSVGIEVWSSPSFKAPYEQNSSFKRDDSKNCRAMSFSPNGQYFAYANGTALKIVNTSDWKEKCSLPRPKTFHLKFSPRGKYLVTWELFVVTKDNPDGSANMHVYEVESGEEMFATIQKKQTDWEPCWSSDESLFALMMGGEAFFYELNGSEGFQSSARKLGGGKNGVLSIGPGLSPPFLAFYVPGVRGSPSMCKIYKYPALQQNQTVACKSFFQDDRVEMLWNKRGTGLLLLTSTEVDQTGASYYGKQALHFMSTKGDSFAVQLSKDGPIHSVSWSPKANEFVVVYGYMPAKATIFNLKCDPIFDFGKGSRNCCYFNDFGNLLIFGGFGNLRGYVEVWDMNKKAQITTLQAPDSTLLEWNPNGEIFLTATTAPRLRIGNGFKIWHYSGALLHETLWPEKQELLEVAWQKYPEGVFQEKSISTEKIEGIKSQQPEASKQVYQPPNVRLMKEGKLPPEAVNTSSSPSSSKLPPGFSKSNTSNSNQKRKRRKPQDKNQCIDGNDGANKNSTDNAKNTEKHGSENSLKTENSDENRKKNYSVSKNENANPQQYQEKTNNEQRQQRPKRYPQRDNYYRNQHQQFSTGDSEKDKKIRNLSRKLQDISKLKAKMNKGEHLEANQLSKLSNEGALIEELRSLKVTT